MSCSSQVTALLSKIMIPPRNIWVQAMQRWGRREGRTDFAFVLVWDSKRKIDLLKNKTQKRDTRPRFSGHRQDHLLGGAPAFFKRECSGVFDDTCSKVHVGLAPSLQIPWWPTSSVLTSGRSPEDDSLCFMCLRSGGNWVKLCEEIISCQLTSRIKNCHWLSQDYVSQGYFAFRWVHVMSFNQWNVSGN